MKKVGGGGEVQWKAGRANRTRKMRHNKRAGWNIPEINSVSIQKASWADSVQQGTQRHTFVNQRKAMSSELCQCGDVWSISVVGWFGRFKIWCWPQKAASVFLLMQLVKLWNTELWTYVMSKGYSDISAYILNSPSLWLLQKHFPILQHEYNFCSIFPAWWMRFSFVNMKSVTI